MAASVAGHHYSEDMSAVSPKITPLIEHLSHVAVGTDAMVMLVLSLVRDSRYLPNFLEDFNV